MREHSRPRTELALCEFAAFYHYFPTFSKMVINVTSKGNDDRDRMNDSSFHGELDWKITNLFSFYVAHAGLKLTIFLPQSLKCWDYRYT
jgi:hypothetical protein